MKGKKKIVIKIGSALLLEEGKLRKKWLDSLAENILELSEKKIEIVIVTSGSIALGISSLKIKKEKLWLEEKQAAAAVGQIELISQFRDSFKEFNLDIAQILLTLGDCNNRERYLNSQNTINTLLKNKIIPVINENDSVAVDEIKIGDNDRLAARVAQMVDADLLILFSDIDGLYDKNPKKHEDAKLILEVEKITKEIENMADGEGSRYGTGGMTTKIQAAKIASNSDCETIITNGFENDCLKDLIEGSKSYTIFRSQKSNKSKKKWLAGFLNATAEIVVNNCAKDALLNKKISLLPVGVVGVRGEFKKGDMIFIRDEAGHHIASGISNYKSSDVEKVLLKKSKEVKEILGDNIKEELVHIDNLVVFV